MKTTYGACCVCELDFVQFCLDGERKVIINCSFCDTERVLFIKDIKDETPIECLICDSTILHFCTDQQFRKICASCPDCDHPTIFDLEEMFEKAKLEPVTTGQLLARSPALPC